MKIIKFIYNIISAVLIIAVVLVTLIALLLGISGMDKENPKSIIGFRAFIVLTDSMTPTFDAGSLIIIKETDAGKLKTGDIITYRPNSSDDVLLTHRIIEISGSGENMQFITMGDANNTEDRPIAPRAIFGKVLFYMNGLGTFIINLRTPIGILGMIAVIAVGLFIIPYLLKLADGKLERKKRSETANNLKKDDDLFEDDSKITDMERDDVDIDDENDN